MHEQAFSFFFCFSYFSCQLVGTNATSGHLTEPGLPAEQILANGVKGNKAECGAKKK